MKKYLLTNVFFFFTIYLFSQNLVPNGDFETYEKCPEHYTRWLDVNTTRTNNFRRFLPGWIYPTAGTPDYFNRCATSSECSVPENDNGIAEPHSGDGYVGMFLAGRATKSYREYISCQLSSPLQKGKKYCVSFWYRLSTYSYYAVDNLGIYFLGFMMNKSTEELLTFKPHVANPEKKYMTNKNEWRQITRVYEAKGTESCLIIGNFDYSIKDIIAADTNAVPKQMRKFERYKTAYYYIDDVSVVELTNCKDCPGIPHDLAVEVVNANFTGGDDGTKNDGEIKLKVSKGTKPYKIKWSNGATTPSLSNLSHGSYTYTVTDKYNCIVSDKITFSGPLKVISESGFHGGNTGWINLTPSGGVPPYRFVWEHGANTEDLDSLEEGTYTYHVYDFVNNHVFGNETFDEFSGQLNNIEEGGKIVLENIFFDFDKTELLPKSNVELNKLVDFMKKFNIKKVEISGHTDSKGGDEYNQKLSEARAKAVVEYLIFMGVEKERLAYVGEGETKPIDTNQSEEGRQNNRRVEFLIKKK